MVKIKKLAAFGLLGLFLIALPVAALAGKDGFKESIYVGPDEIIEGNFIQAGSTIDINGPVNGDIIVAGSSITINGPVAGDVIAAGSTVRVNGPVAGSVRVAGSSVEISSAVEKNVWAVGSTVAISEEASVGWDIYSAGASVEIKSPVGGNVWASGTNIIIANQVGKDVHASVDQAGQLTLYPEARVLGNLNYKAETEDQLVLREGAEVTGETTKKQYLDKSDFDPSNIFGTAYVFFKLISFFSLLVIGIIFVSLMPKALLKVEEKMIAKPWPSLGWGLVVAVFTPIVSLLLLFTVIGIPLVLIIIPGFMILFYVSKVFAGFTIGLLLFNNMSKDKKYKGTLVWPLVVGLIIFVLLSAIPVFGWFLKIALTLWAMGAVLSFKKEILKEYK